MKLARWLAAAVVLMTLPGCQHLASPRPSKPAPTKVLVIMIENKGLARVQREAPRLWALGKRYAVATHYTAITHPSRPNYYAISAGSTFGLSDRLTDVPGPTLLSGTLRAGRTARVYAESMPAPCHTINDGKYVARHNPWTWVHDEREDCRRNDVSLPRLYADVAHGQLPNVGLLIPNNCHNAHDCDLQVADDWVSTRVAMIMRGPDWKAGRLLIIITADEDDHNEGNRLFTALLHPKLTHTRVGTRLNHYSLSRALSAFGHTQPLRHASHARDLLKAFGLAQP